jgi:hypothetical protein
MGCTGIGKMTFLRRELTSAKESRTAGKRAGNVRKSAGELAERDHRAFFPVSTRRR